MSDERSSIILLRDPCADKVEQYLEDNGLPSPDLEELECIIFDSDFYNSL